MPTAEDRERNIQNVINTAVSCFKEHGIVGTSQIMIATAAGLSSRSIQRYFNSKTQLVAEAVKYVVNDHCEQILTAYEKYHEKNYTGLENLVYLIRLHSFLLNHNIELFVFLEEADMYLRHQGLNILETVMSIINVDKIRKLFENAFYSGISDGSIKNDIQVSHEYLFLNSSLTGLLYQVYQIASHSSHDRIDESKSLQEALLRDFIQLYIKHLENATG